MTLSEIFDFVIIGILLTFLFANRLSDSHLLSYRLGFLKDLFVFFLKVNETNAWSIVRFLFFNIVIFGYLLILNVIINQEIFWFFSNKFTSTYQFVTFGIFVIGYLLVFLNEEISKFVYRKKSGNNLFIAYLLRFITFSIGQIFLIEALLRN